MMKCENCPYFAVEGVQNNMNWCKLYNGEAPIQGCEGERDALLKQQELMRGYLEKEE